MGRAAPAQDRARERRPAAPVRTVHRRMLDRRAARCPGRAPERALAQMERILFLTGRLARKSLESVLAGITPAAFEWEIKDIGIQVAGLMTADMIRRRVPRPEGIDRVLVPGRCRGDLAAL